jgi:hypothetical protein
MVRIPRRTGIGGFREANANEIIRQDAPPPSTPVDIRPEEEAIARTQTAGPKISVGSLVSHPNLPGTPYIVTAIDQTTGTAKIAPFYSIPTSEGTKIVFQPPAEKLTVYPGKPYRIITSGVEKPTLLIDPLSLSTDSGAISDQVILGKNQEWRYPEAAYVGMQLYQSFGVPIDPARYWDENAYTMLMPDLIDVRGSIDRITTPMKKEDLIDAIDTAIHNLEMISKTTPEKPQIKMGTSTYRLSNLRIVQSATRAIEQLKSLKKEIEQINQKEIEVVTPIQLAAYEELLAKTPSEETTKRSFEEIYDRMQSLLSTAMSNNDVAQAINQLKSNAQAAGKSPAQTVSTAQPSFTRLLTETTLSKNIRDIVESAVAEKMGLPEDNPHRRSMVGWILRGKTRTKQVGFPLQLAQFRTLMRNEPEKIKTDPRLENLFISGLRRTILSEIKRLARPILTREKMKELMSNLMRELTDKTLRSIQLYSSTEVIEFVVTEGGELVQLGTAKTTSPQIGYIIVGIETPHSS